MQENHSALGNKAFGDASDALTTVKYRSHIDAVKSVESALREAGGISLLFGSDGAGKSTILRQFSMHLSAESDVIYLDGRDLDPRPPDRPAARRSWRISDRCRQRSDHHHDGPDRRV